MLGKMGHSERFGNDLYKNVDGNKDQRLFEGRRGVFCTVKRLFFAAARPGQNKINRTARFHARPAAVRESGRPVLCGGQKKKACTGNAEVDAHAMEENKAQCFLRRCMCAACALMFAFLSLFFCSVLRARLGAGWRTAAFVCLLVGAVLLCQHFAAFVAKYFFLLTGGAALAFFAAALVFAAMLRFDPIYDLEAIYRGGEGWGVYGELMRFTSQTFDPNYFTAGTTTWAARHSWPYISSWCMRWAAGICFWQRQA